MKEAGRDCGGRSLMQIQWWEGGVLRCAQAVPQGRAHGSLWEKVLVGKDHVVESAMEADGRGDLLGARQGVWRSDGDRCFMRRVAENEVEFQKPRAFRFSRTRILH